MDEVQIRYLALKSKRERKKNEPPPLIQSFDKSPFANRKLQNNKVTMQQLRTNLGR